MTTRWDRWTPLEAAPPRRSMGPLAWLLVCYALLLTLGMAAIVYEGGWL